MHNINGYGNFTNPAKTYGQANKTEKTNTTAVKNEFYNQLDEAKKETEKTEKKQDGLYISSAGEKAQELSKTAQDYLAKLKKENPNLDFIISDYSTDEEADALLAKGKGEYNVLITPDLLEKMAADEEVAAEYEGIIHSSIADIKSAKEQLADDADMVEKFGVSVNSDGEVTYHASLIEGLTSDDGSKTVKASTIDELLERLNEVKKNQAEKLAEIRAKKAEEAEKAEEKATVEDETTEAEAAAKAAAEVTRLATSIIEHSEEIIEATKFADFTTQA